MYKVIFTLLWIVAIACYLGSCMQENSIESNNEDELLGGETTVNIVGVNSFANPLDNLNPDYVQKHLEADNAFAQPFITAPAPNFGGLGPIFNKNSCESCHIRNGRGHVSIINNNVDGIVMRISLDGKNPKTGIVAVPNFGGQLQTSNIIDVQAEGKIKRSTSTKVFSYPDGTTVNLTQPQYTIHETYTNFPSGVNISPRMAPPVFGLGLVDAIQTDDILRYEDINDDDKDGISGKANRVWNVKTQQYNIGKYGWKAEQPTALQQTADAAHQDMGLTNSFFPKEVGNGQSNVTKGLQSTLDIDDEMLELLSFYFETLAVPARRNVDDINVIAGKRIFFQAKCQSCHRPNFMTGTHTIEALRNQNIFPYSDFLLHDMGEGLADNRSTFDADGNEWRTPPLWGIGLTNIVNPEATYLHDGRANTLEEAILWHEGEAKASRDYFANLSQGDREKLLLFLKSL